jgi:RNA polymerase sigma factor (sigma-70 family)
MCGLAWGNKPDPLTAHDLQLETRRLISGGCRIRKIFLKKSFRAELFARPLAFDQKCGELCTHCSLNLRIMATLQTTAESMAHVRQSRIFQREFVPLMDAVYSFAYRLTGDATQAEELVQETFLKAWRFIDRYAEGTNAKAWLFRICRNAFINEYRNTRNTPYKVDYEDIVVYHNEDDPAATRYLDLHEEMGGKLMGDEVMYALNGLSDEFRVVVLLDMEDFTYEEIAAIAGIPIGTVRSRLHRARKVLAEKLREYAQAQGYNVQDDEAMTSGGEPTKTNNES